MKKLILVAAAAAVALLSGCATIVGDRTQLIGISSTPSSATVSVTDDAGNQVFSGTTPTTVTLKKSDGSYFGGETYVLTFKKAGYSERSVTIKAHPNGWYIGGNIIFGGLIGWLIVDPMTGAMYTLSPESVDTSLAADQKTAMTYDGKGLHVMLLKNVPVALRAKMKRVVTATAK